MTKIVSVIEFSYFLEKSSYYVISMQKILKQKLVSRIHQVIFSFLSLIIVKKKIITILHNTTSQA